MKQMFFWNSLTFSTLLASSYDREHLFPSGLNWTPKITYLCQDQWPWVWLARLCCVPNLEVAGEKGGTFCLKDTNQVLLPEERGPDLEQANYHGLLHWWWMLKEIKHVNCLALYGKCFFLNSSLFLSLYLTTWYISGIPFSFVACSFSSSTPLPCCGLSLPLSWPIVGGPSHWPHSISLC